MTDASVTESPHALEVRAPGALEQQIRGEVDVQIATAKRYPRSVRTFLQQAQEMATLDEETAESCFYALPRDGKTVEGPSARLAEICASAYGHIRAEARIVAEDERFITARATAWDIQNNVAVAFEVRRRITTSEKKNKNGQTIPSKRYSDDMIVVTGNAASSIALRNAVFKVIPSAFWRPIYEKCRQVAVGNADTLANRRAKMLEHFQKMGVPSERVFTVLGVKGVEDITLDHLATLKGTATAIKDGDTTVDEAFPNPVAAAKAATTQNGKPAPEGYEQWLDDLHAVADEGEAAFSKTWAGSKEEFRTHMAQTAPTLFDSLKARALAKDGKR